MTFKELCDWVKSSKKLDEQVVLALAEEDEPDEILDEVGKVCYLPFRAITLEERIIKDKIYPVTSRIFIELWKDEKIRSPKCSYTWGDFVIWVEGLIDPGIEATALAAWNLCKLKILKNGMLYAWQG